SPVVAVLPVLNRDGHRPGRHSFPTRRSSDLARIRGTYGLVASMGNANNSSTVYYNRMTYRPYELEKEAMIYISSLKNSNLTWERSEEHTSELQSRENLVCRLLLEKKKVDSDA